MNVRHWGRQLGWALPWLLFLIFPVVDLVRGMRSTSVEVTAVVLLLVFTVAYLRVFHGVFGRDGGPVHRELAVVTVLGLGLTIWLGPGWAGLPIYVSAAAAATLPVRWVWLLVAASVAVSAVVLTAHGLLGELFFLPLICALTAFALRGTRRLIEVNNELVEAREERARAAVAEERLRFARDLHDLLGHSLSMIALKSELAGRLAENDPSAARREMADVESAARQALAEVREAVSGYRRVDYAQALAEARSALSAAGIALRIPRAAPGSLLPAADEVLGWVLREATTNVLRHSGAGQVTVTLDRDDDELVLTVADDGRGVGGPPGTGLTGLGERLAALGGRLEAGPGGAGGFLVRAELPLDSRVRAT